jgi:hemerythrin-like domain-containing protein
MALLRSNRRTAAGPSLAEEAETMSANRPWCVLEFRFDAVEAWQDAQLASAVERAWQAEGCPQEVVLWCEPAADEYAFRWFANEAAVRLLDCAGLSWRQYVIQHRDEVPPRARLLLLPPGQGTSMATTVTDAFTRDHRRLDALLDDVHRMVTDGELERADHTFREFDEGLAHHMRLEEALVFPPLEQRVGVYFKMTATLREEHRQLLSAVNELRQAFDHLNGRRIREQFPGFVAALSSHSDQEQRIIYPAIDQALRHADRASLATQLKPVGN